MVSFIYLARLDLTNLSCQASSYVHKASSEELLAGVGLVLEV